MTHYPSYTMGRCPKSKAKECAKRNPEECRKCRQQNEKDQKEKNVQITSQTFEHDWIIHIVNSLLLDLQTTKNKDQCIDKCCVALTAFMQGQILEAVKNEQKQKEKDHA